MSNPAPTQGGSKAFLLVAVVLGILATVMAVIFIQKGGNDSGNELTIVVAKHDLSPAKPIDPDADLMTATIPAKFAAMMPGRLSWEGRGAYKGERVNRDVFAGQPVLLADLAAVGQLVLEKPYYALTIPADTGMLIPGDYVKIIVSRPGSGSTPGVPIDPAHPIYDATVIGKDEGYKVLAVGGYLFKSRTQALLSDQYQTNASSIKSVTLRVTEAEAKEIIGAAGTDEQRNQKAMMLICPSDMTAAEATTEKGAAFRSRAPATRRGP